MQYKLYFKVDRLVQSPTGFSGSADDCMKYIRGWLDGYAHATKTIPLEPMNPAPISFSSDLLVRSQMEANNVFRFHWILKPLSKK